MEVNIYDSWSEENPILLGKLYASYIKEEEKISIEFSDKYIGEYPDFFGPDLFYSEGRNIKTWRN